MIVLFQFVSADVYGVFCWAFSDFGPSFEVVDSTGEEPKQCFVANITKVRTVATEAGCGLLVIPVHSFQFKGSLDTKKIFCFKKAS